MANDIPFFLRPDALASEAYQGLTPEQKDVCRQLRDSGYAIVRNAVDHGLIDTIIADCDARFAGGGLVGNRIQDAFTFSEPVNQLATNDRILQLLSAAYGREAFPFQTLNFKTGTQQRTHSDTVHFNSIPGLFMTGVWVAFEAVHADNGPLHYYEESAKLPVFDYHGANIYPGDAKRFGADCYPEYEDYVERLTKGLGLTKHDVVLQKGDAFIWAANLLHGGSPINDPASTRWSQVTHFYYKDCIYYTPMQSDLIKGKLAVRRPFDIRTGAVMSLDEWVRNAAAAGMNSFELFRHWFYQRTGL